MIEPAQVQARSEQPGLPTAVHLVRVHVAVEVVAPELCRQAQPARGVVGERSRRAVLAKGIERSARIKIDVAVPASDLIPGRKPSGRILIRAASRCRESSRTRDWHRQQARRSLRGIRRWLGRRGLGGLRSAVVTSLGLLTRRIVFLLGTNGHSQKRTHRHQWTQLAHHRPPKNLIFGKSCVVHASAWLATPLLPADCVRRIAAYTLLLLRDPVSMAIPPKPGAVNQGDSLHEKRQRAVRIA